MSLQNIAQHLANQGRGKDTTLVHMTPNEVSGLAALARANGKEISVNPQTGLPEAGALESIFAGLALNYIAPGFGGAIGEMLGLSGAAGTGLAIGAGTAAITGNIGKGFEAGFGAYTGAGLGESLAGLGMGELGREASSSAVNSIPFPQEGADAATREAYNKAIQDSVASSMKSATKEDKYGAGLNFAGNNPGAAFKATAKYLAPAALSIFADKGVNDVQTTTPQQKPNPGVYHPFTYDRYAQTMTPGQRYTAANGGLMSLANGGAVRRFDEGGISLDTMYKNVLGREADAGGREFWQQQFGDKVDDTELAAFRQSALGGTDTADKTSAQAFGITANNAGAAGGYGKSNFIPDAALPEGMVGTAGGTGYDSVTGRLDLGTAGGSGQYVLNAGTAPVAQAPVAQAGIAALPSAAPLAVQPAPVAVNNVVSQQQGPLITDQVYDLFKNVLDRPPSEKDMKYWSTQFGINNNTIDPNEIADFKSAASKELADRKADFDSSKDYIPISQLDNLYQQELSRHGEYGKDGKEGGMEFWKRTFGDYINPEELAGFKVEAAKERAAREKATMPDVVTDLTTADTAYVKPGVGGSTGAGQEGGGTVVNPNGTITTSPRIPGIPVGGFTGMTQVRDVYTKGGGKLGYVPYAPKTIEEFNTKYKNTGDSKAMYDYLMGKGPYPTTTGTADVDAAGKKVFREPSKVYSEVMGGPVNPNKQYNFNKETGKYDTNPDYVRQEKIVDPTTKERSVINYMTLNQAKAALDKNKLEGNALADWAILNNVHPSTLAEATGMTYAQINALLAKAKADKAFSKKEGGLMSLAKGGLASFADGGQAKEYIDSSGSKYYFDFANGIYRPETAVKDGITYKWNPVTNKYETTSASGTGIASLAGGDGGSPAGGENPAKTTPDWGTAFQIGKTLSNMGLTSVGGYVERAATNGILGQSNQAAITADALPATTTGLPQGYDTAASRAGNAAATAAAQAEAAATQAARSGQPGGGDVSEGSYEGYDVGNAPSGDNAKGGMIGHYAQGGLGSLGGYSDGGRLLRGPGDGVSDSIPASIGRGRQPARLADGEFVVPARIVSELGNGSTEAGARALYKMMARIQANRRKTTGKNSVAVDSKSHKYLPA